MYGTTALINRRVFTASLCASALRGAPGLPLTEVLRAGLEQHQIPGAAVSVFRGGKIDEKVCSGLRKSGVPDIVVPLTLFEAASLSKPLFATAVMRLAGRGGIKLDQPLMEYLGGPYTHIQQPWDSNSPKDELTDERAVKLTPRLVLSHRTGLPNWAYRSKLAFQREPGTGWGYSGEGYVMLQEVVEQITKMDLETFTRKEVLGPLGLEQSRWTWNASLAGNVASGHFRNGAVKGETGQPVPNAAASLMTSLDEYGRFLEAVLTAKPDVLEPAQHAEMLRPAATADEALGIRWGLGWGLAEDRGGTYIFHWGANNGYRNFFFISAKNRDGFLMFSNSDNGMKLLPALAETVLGFQPRVLKWSYLR